MFEKLRFREKCFFIKNMFLGSISDSTKIRLNRCIGKCFKFCKLRFIFLKRVTGLRIKIVFLKLCNPTLFINLSGEAAQLLTMGKPTGI